MTSPAHACPTVTAARRRQSMPRRIPRDSLFRLSFCHAGVIVPSAAISMQTRSRRVAGADIVPMAWCSRSGQQHCSAVSCNLESRDHVPQVRAAAASRKKSVRPSVPFPDRLVTAQFIQFNLPHHPATLAALNGPPEAPEANTLLVAT